MTLEELAEHLKIISRIDDNNREYLVEVSWSENGLQESSKTAFVKQVRDLIVEFTENPTIKQQRKLLEIPYKLYTTDFRKALYKAVRTIPFGETASYKDMAQEINSAPRAVGQAIKHNPLMILVPCHRVIKHDGTIGGYFGESGLDLKRELLFRENNAKA